jgi:ribosomal protein L11 methyltransferase
VIPASQAFGTGQHATTAGCLAMLAHMKAQGTIVRNLADIGTGTGLLAFAAMHLWPSARAIASDIDAVCAPVVLENAQGNGVAIGDGSGALTMVVAAGMDHPLLAASAPYDLLIANILAGPLTELAPAFAGAVAPGGSVLLAGLLETQEPAVRAAYRRAGLRLAARLVRGDWSILWLRRRQGGAVRKSRVGALPEWSKRW